MTSPQQQWLQLVSACFQLEQHLGNHQQQLFLLLSYSHTDRQTSLSNGKDYASTHVQHKND